MRPRSQLPLKSHGENRGPWPTFAYQQEYPARRMQMRRVSLEIVALFAPYRDQGEQRGLAEIPCANALRAAPILLRKNKHTLTGTSGIAWEFAESNHNNGIPTGCGSCDASSKC